MIKIALLFLIILVPGVLYAQNFVTCDGVNTECDLDKLMELVSRVLEYMVKISIPIAAGVFAWAGFLLMTTGIADKRNEAKSMIKKVFIGLVLMLGAWLIVDTLKSALFESSITTPVDLD